MKKTTIQFEHFQGFPATVKTPAFTGKHETQKNMMNINESNKKMNGTDKADRTTQHSREDARERKRQRMRKQ